MTNQKFPTSNLNENIGLKIILQVNSNSNTNFSRQKIITFHDEQKQKKTDSLFSVSCSIAHSLSRHFFPIFIPNIIRSLFFVSFGLLALRVFRKFFFYFVNDECVTHDPCKESRHICAFKIQAARTFISGNDRFVIQLE